jgi:hypothetical protein
MKGDITRDSFSPSHGFTRVLMQQGRVQLDADWNEQMSILWDCFRGMVVDLVGPHAGPQHDCGFRILTAGDLAQTEPSGWNAQRRKELKQLLQSDGDFLIGEGVYYVDGFPCRNDFAPFSYTTQPYLPGLAPLKPVKYAYLVYIDVWERHLTQIEDPRIGEVALSGTDTATRAKLIWQIRTLELADKHRTCEKLRDNWEDLLYDFRSRHRAYLRAMAKMPAKDDMTEAPLSGPEAQFRGTENRLYRVEIHDPGPVGDNPTFKWSRDNGTVIFPISSIDVTTGNAVVTLGDPAKDSHADLAPGDWVEIVDDTYALENRAEALLVVENVDAGGTLVTLKGVPVSTVGRDPSQHPLLRRWDQKTGNPKRGGLELRGGAALIREGVGDSEWMMLEDGVQIQFVKTDPPSYFSTGDYWLIPARTATGDIIWPRANDKPAPSRPHGPKHHFAPLAIVEFNKDGQLCLVGDCRPKIKREVSL